MTLLAIIGALAGAVFGLRCKVLVLVPTILIALIIVTAAGLARGHDAWSIMLASALIATVLQLGYLVGVFMRFTMAGARRARPGKVWSPASVSESRAHSSRL